MHIVLFPEFDSVTSFLSAVLCVIDTLRSQKKLNLLSDTGVDPTFGEVHLSSTTSVCSVGYRQSVCADLSFVIISVTYFTVQSEYSRSDCRAPRGALS